MYDKYYVRKKEIAENILMIVICDVEQDGIAYLGDNDAEGDQQLEEQKNKDEYDEDDFSTVSTFNMAQVDLLFSDFETNFKAKEELISEISKQINNTM